MNSTTDPKELAPGRYLVGSSLVVWVQNPTRMGLFHSGTLDRTDHTLLAQLFAPGATPLLAGDYDVLHDLSALRVFDDEAFVFAERLVDTWGDAFARSVRRLAVVRPGGLAGATVTGMFHHWVASRFDARLVGLRADAYEFLDVSHEDRQTLDSLAAERASPLMRRFRDALMMDVRGATLARAAASIMTSPRSLQRMLAAHGTTFRTELARARIRLAETILLDREDKLEAIAREIGFSSASNFSTMFARATGQAPSMFRARYRARL